ncbi:hypothetical protein [Streptomyces sp. NPDC058751]|uniref:hypothetical protein n=1 Tax=Streptomyces sp. NPDC058751 TaxID=3346623 RepID=UPI003679D9B6
MSPSPGRSDEPVRPPDPSHARDRGLRRSRRLTRWIAVAAVTGAAALGTLYTHLLPGNSASTAPSNPPLRNPAASSAAASKADDDTNNGNSAGQENGDGEGEDDLGAAPASHAAPQPPSQPPAPTQQQPHTTTGAS